MKHTFVICAYKESKFLEECIISLKKQSIKSEILIATSTPNKYIEDIAKKYGIEIFINNGQKGITQDWNFGLDKVRTRYATVAHQDDVYESSYAEKIINEMEKHNNSIIAFSDYSELRNAKKVHDTTMLKIKLVEGKNRQVKKMFESVGHPVKRLHRVSIGCVNLKGLTPGKYRILKPQEVKDLKKLVNDKK